jgi:hypothetical protein
MALAPFVFGENGAFLLIFFSVLPTILPEWSKIFAFQTHILLFYLP